VASVDVDPAPQDTSALIDSIRAKGVRLWTANGQLHYECAKGMLAPADFAAIRRSREQIVRQLDAQSRSNTIRPRQRGSDRPERIPLSFSQLQHWNLYELGERRAIRTVTSAIRLDGSLCVAALKQSLILMLNRHETLRTRIVLCGGAPLQEIDDTAGLDFRTIDLTALRDPGQQERAVIETIRAFILEEIDPALGPLFAVRLLELTERSHVLVISMEHMISDGFSLNLLAREVFELYSHTVRGKQAEPPQELLQFADYALWQRNNHEAWTAQHGPYWRRQVAGLGRCRFPEDREPARAVTQGRGSVQLRISSDLTRRLREWCRRNASTPPMSLFAAYSALVLRWCGQPEALFQYQTNARFMPEIENTIGYFASVLYLRMVLHEQDSFSELVGRATREYCTACEHCDFSYLASQTPRPSFTQNTSFNWIPLGSLKLDFAGLAGSEHELTATPVHFAYPAQADLDLDREPFLIVSDSRDEIVFDVYFSLQRFSPELMDRFGRNLVHFLEAGIGAQIGIGQMSLI